MSHHPRFLAVPLLVVALVGAACGGSVAPAAATVNGTRIDAGRIDAELRAIRDNKAFRDQIEGGGSKVVGAGKQTFDAEFAAQVVTNQIYLELISAELERREIGITPADVKKGRSGTIDRVGGRAVFNKFRRAYQDLLLRRTAEVNKLAKALGAADQTPQEYYDAHPEEFTNACVSHILVATLEKAQQVRAQLEAGADFATLAKAESTDPSAQQNAGDLGCNDPSGFVEPFKVAVGTIELNELSQPVQTDFGFHVLRVTQREARPFDQAEVATKLGQQGDEAFNTWLIRALDRAKISVSRRYGRFDKGTKDGSRRPQVIPPKAPKSKEFGDSPGSGGATSQPSQP